MYHISDCKKFNRCPRLFLYEQSAEKTEFNSFVRMDEEVTKLAAQKLHIEDCFLGERADDKEIALRALNDYEWLVKARFEYDRLRIKVPFLHKVGTKWDLYFLFTGVYPHADDMQFYCDTVWVLEKNGIALNHMYLIHLNSNYVRGEELDPEELFVISDCFYNKHNNPSVSFEKQIYDNMRNLTPLLDQMDACNEEMLPPLVRMPRCNSRNKCRYYDTCFQEETEEPDNSILTLVASQHRYAMKKEGLLTLKEADVDRIEGSRNQYAEIMADTNGGLFVDKCALKAWLLHIQYPITFLDFEWECFAIPPYIGMRPYQVLPFEYSIHILHEDGELEHKVFLSIHDDRKEMAEGLLRDIPEVGSVVAYNAEAAEVKRIRELANQFPEYRDKLLAINARMEDLQLPFLTGTVYDTRMKGQWSLKVIMAMMNDKSYHDLDIQQGMEAVFQWRHLDRNEDTDSDKIIEDLKAYCGMDSYAMAVVYKWLLTICD